MALNPKQFIRVPFPEILSPFKLGPLNVYRDHWWAVDEDNCVLFFRYMTSPQCNINKEIVKKHLASGLQVRAEFVPWAFVPFKHSDYY